MSLARIQPRAPFIRTAGNATEVAVLCPPPKAAARAGPLGAQPLDSELAAAPPGQAGPLQRPRRGFRWLPPPGGFERARLATERPVTVDSPRPPSTEASSVAARRRAGAGASVCGMVRVQGLRALDSTFLRLL